MPDAPIRIESFESVADGCAATLLVSSPSFMRTSSVPALADAILEALPGLVRHPCECGSAHGIAAELGDTEMPHLIEHVALELLAVSGAPRRELYGHTTWNFARDGAGVFHVSLHGAPPEDCENALRQATALVVAHMFDPLSRSRAL